MMLKLSDLEFNNILLDHTEWLKTDDHKSGGYRCADFSYKNLAGRDLSNLDLRYANFENACLVGTTFEGSDVRGANFENADLYLSNLVNVLFGECIFRNTNLTKCYLNGSNLSNLKLDIKAEETFFGGCILFGTNFTGSILNYANFEGSDLRYANFKNCELRNVNFDDAEFKLTSFQNVNTSSIVLSETQLNNSTYKYL